MARVEVRPNWGFLTCVAFCFGFWAEVFYWFETGKFVPW